MDYCVRDRALQLAKAGTNCCMNKGEGGEGKVKINLRGEASGWSAMGLLLTNKAHYMERSY